MVDFFSLISLIFFFLIFFLGGFLVVELLMGLPLENLSLDHSDMSNNTALHLSCLQVSQHCLIVPTLVMHN